MSWLDKLIRTVSPAWAYRRQQFREALRTAEEEAAAPRQPAGASDWVPWDRSPLNPEVAQGRANQDAAWPARRRWTW